MNIAEEEMAGVAMVEMAAIVANAVVPTAVEPKPHTVPGGTGDCAQSEACWLGLGTAVLAAGWDWVGTGDCSPLRSTGTGRCSPDKKLSCHLEIE